MVAEVRLAVVSTPRDGSEGERLMVAARGGRRHGQDPESRKRRTHSSDPARAGRSIAAATMYSVPAAKKSWEMSSPTSGRAARSEERRVGKEGRRGRCRGRRAERKG